MMALNLTAGDAFSVSGLIGLIGCLSFIFIYLRLGEGEFLAWPLSKSWGQWQKTASGLALAGLGQPKIEPGGVWYKVGGTRKKQ